MFYIELCAGAGLFFQLVGGVLTAVVVLVTWEKGMKHYPWVNMATLSPLGLLGVLNGGLLEGGKGNVFSYSFAYLLGALIVVPFQFFLMRCYARMTSPKSGSR